MSRLSGLAVVLITLAMLTSAQPAGNLGGFEGSSDVGAVQVAGSYESIDGKHLVVGAGHDIWGTADGFHYVYSRVAGDFDVSVRITDLEPVNPWTKAGLMVRGSLQESSSHASVFLTPQNGTAFQRRVGSGNESITSPGSGVTAPLWLRLQRVGHSLRSYESDDGISWNLIGGDTVRLAEEVFVGLAVTSHDTRTATQAVFDGFELDVRPAIDGDDELARAFREPQRRETGLHYTPEEVEIWRQRTEEGPYRVENDARSNSPGDWQRILKNANRFLRNPQEALWDGPQASGCVPMGFSPPPTQGSDDMRDAAFVYLVVGGDAYAAAVKEILLSSASNPALDFSRSDHWCYGVLSDTTFTVAQYLSRMLFAYDYLGEEQFTADERFAVETWFHGAAAFLQTEVDNSLSQLFLNRAAGDYRLAEEASRRCGRVTHFGGHDLCAIHLFYNNRRASQAEFFALVGLSNDDASLQHSAKLFFQEWLKYGVFPDGLMGEFERWTVDNPDLGWGYAGSLTATMITIADHFARAGDSSLYNYATSDGALGTVGGDKSLLLVIKTLGHLVDGSLAIYGTDDPDRAGRPEYLIDGVNESAGWYGMQDILVAQANVYYRDPYVYEMYTRTGQGMPGYPERPAPYGPRVVWMGDGGLYPALLFMFGEMEGQVFPYPSEQESSGRD